MFDTYFPAMLRLKRGPGRLSSCTLQTVMELTETDLPN